MLKRYPLDTTGQSPSNLVKRELHTLDVDTENRILFTRMGAYYNHSLVVTQGDKTLVLNKDYLLFFLWQDASVKTGMPVSRGIHVINKNLLGDIELRYQVVGGEFQDQNEGITDLQSLLPYNLKKVYWDEVLEKPLAYIPTQHLHHIHDVFGVHGIVKAIEELRRTVERLSVHRLKIVYDRFLKLKQYVEANLGIVDEQRTKLSEALVSLDEKLKNYITRDEATDIITGSLATKQAEDNRRYEELKAKDVELATAIDTAKQEVLTRIDTLVTKDAELKREIDALATSTRDADTALRNTINANKETLENRINTAKQEATLAVNNLNDTLRQHIASEKTAILTEADRQATEKNNALLTTVNQNIARVSDALNTAKTELTEKITTAETNAENRVNAILPRITKNENDIAELKAKDNELTTSINNTNNSLSEFKTLTTQNITTIKSDINGLRDTITRMGNVSEESINNLRLQITQKNNEQDTLIGELRTDLQNANNRITEVDNKYNTKVNDLTARVVKLEESNVTTKRDIETLRNEKADKTALAEVSNKVNTIATEYPNAITNEINNFNTTTVEPFKTAITTRVATVERNLGTAETNIRNNTLAIETLRTEKADKNVVDALVTDYTQFKTTTENSIEQLENDIVAANQSATDKVNALKQEQNAKITTINNTLTNDVVPRLTTLETSVDNNTRSITELRSQLTQATGDTTTKLAELKDTINTELVTPLRNEFTASQDVQNRRLDALETKDREHDASITRLTNDKADKVTVDQAINSVDNKVTQLKTKVDGLKTDIDNTLIKPLKRQLDANVSTVANNLNTLQTNVNDLTTRVTNVENNKADKTTVEELSNGLDDVKADIPVKIAEAKRDIQTTLIAPLQATNTQQDTTIGDLTTRVEALENAPAPTGGMSYDEATFTRLVKEAMDRNIAESNQYSANDVALNLVHPDTEGSVTFENGATKRIYPVSAMDGSVTEMIRNVFAPGTIYEFETNTTWTIPDIYNGLMAQVFVTTGVRGKTLPSGSILFQPPCTKVGYVLLRGGVNVPITVGQISSFGTYLTNDGVDKKGVLTPTYPIIVPAGNYSDQNEDIRNHFGKHGKVVVIV